MNRARIKTYRHRIGKNLYLIIKINQSATAKAEQGNVLASNALNVQIFKNKKKQKK
ncbi:hypothetical protein SAMN05444487_11258 [Marininema mesophilum]|uniref:Uncharacterized protein n=1 Tax=Marininema mesophilum TaxID=1048340 RepID=A0A1H3A0M8_9BACL|nr:hypothetical protein [Marininema mesophilum]SDX22469.1 hypothetical protein SAMN05444487_11258 [Marininema mesophilum]